MEIQEKIQIAENLKLEGKTYKEIAVVLNLSRQRAQQLITPPVIIKQIIIDRAKSKCEICHKKIRKNGHFHHRLIKNMDINHPDNLQYLCLQCHVGLHYKIGSYDVNHPRTLTLKDIDPWIVWNYSVKHPNTSDNKLAEKFGVKPKLIRIILSKPMDDYLDIHTELDKYKETLFSF